MTSRLTLCLVWSDAIAVCWPLTAHQRKRFVVVDTVAQKLLFYKPCSPEPFPFVDEPNKFPFCFKDKSGDILHILTQANVISRQSPTTNWSIEEHFLSKNRSTRETIAMFTTTNTISGLFFLSIQLNREAKIYVLFQYYINYVSSIVPNKCTF